MASVELAGGCFEQAEERWAGPARAGFEFRVKLHTNVVRVVVEFENFAPLTRFVLADKDQPGFFDAFDEVGVDLVAVSVALVHCVARAVQGSNG